MPKPKLQSLVQSAKRKAVPITVRDANDDKFVFPDGSPIDTEHMLIQLMLPTAVKAFFKELEDNVNTICGERSQHADGLDGCRWGTQQGSIFMANQRVAVERQRVRSKTTGKEIVPEVYERFQNPALFRQQVFVDGMRKVSQRDFSRGLPQVAASFGVTKSSVSRTWIKATEKKFLELMTRDITAMDIVAVFIDGKRFRKQGVVVALGVASTGQKFVLGIYQADSENSAACCALLDNLQKRGLPERGLLFVVDGGSGLGKSLNEKYLCHDPSKRRAIRVRCFKHKWQNIHDVLPEEFRDEAAALFWGLRDCQTRSEADVAARPLKALLKRVNLSALKSFEEAEDDLLALFDLRVPKLLRDFLSTTNAIESLNSLTEEDLRRVKRWRDSEHFCRWLSTSCLHNEKRMRRIRGHRAMPALKLQLRSLCTAESIDSQAAIA